VASYIIRRFISMIVTLWLVITITFFLMHTVPGSPFDKEGRNSNPVAVQNMMEFYNLDKPLSVQYLIYLKSLASLDLGPSIGHFPDTVNSMISRGFPVSFKLGMISFRA
jgi:dipeptide transport system permease protein